tara:strand:- start:30857 stop:31294 length:438 start_codon:yes stop_codon:yes gene_type:complete
MVKILHPIYHSKCGSIVFYYDDKPKVGDHPVYEKATWPDGNRVESICDIPCESCGLRSININETVIEKPEETMVKEPIITTQLTSKELKKHLFLSGAFQLLGLILVVVNIKQEEQVVYVVLGCLMFLSGVIYRLVTNVRVWWNHS